MSSIYGIFARDGAQVLVDNLLKINSALSHWQPDSNHYYQHNNIGLGQLLLINSPYSASEHLPVPDDTCKLAITADATIYNRSEILALTHHSSKEYQQMPDSLLILQAYLKWGIYCTKYLEGDFAFAIWDDNKQQLFCARDHMGVRPFFYYDNNTQFVFASEPKGLLALPFIQTQENEEWLADMLLLDPSYKADTYFKGIKRLKAAHSMVISRQKIEVWPYWQLTATNEINFSTPQDYVEQYRELFKQSIKSRIQSLLPVGAELSGGLDSSAICAVAAKYLKATNHPFITFSSVLDEQSKQPNYIQDEKQQILTVIEHCQIEQYQFVASNGCSLIKAYEKMISYNNGPLVDLHSLLSDILLDTAQHYQIRTLLSGFGGDELATHQASNLLTECIHQRLWQTYLQEINAIKKKTGRSLGKQIVISFLQAYLPSLYYGYLTKIRHVNQGILLLYDRYGSLGCQQNFKIKKQLALRTQRPRQLKYTTLNFPLGTFKEKAMTFISHYKHLRERIECSSLAALHCKINYTFPLLDRKLLEFCINIPLTQFRHAGIGRQLMRQAMKSYLPESICWRLDKTGSTHPSYYHRLTIQKCQLRAVISQFAQHKDLWCCEKLLQNFVEKFDDYINNSSRLLPLIYILLALTIEWYRLGKTR